MNLVDLLEKRDGTRKMVLECLETVKKYDKVVAFGAGVGGAALYQLLKNNDLINRLVAWSDNNELKFGKTYMQDDLYVIRPEEIIEKFGSNIGVIVSSSAYDIIKSQLISYGIKSENIYLFNFAFMDLEHTDCEFIYEHIDDFERAYRKMFDDKSCKIFMNILNYRITKDETFLINMQNYVDDEHYQYFDPQIFKFVPQERFLDVGAYIGDTFSAFNEVYLNGWEHYYGIEADKNIYNELNNVILNNGYSEKCTLVNVAAWNEDTTLYFESVSGSSTMKNNKNLKNAVSAKIIDNVISGEISFVKMDIEGAEYNALCGMKNIIKKNKPILAICVYHLRDDFFKLTDFIEGLVPNEYAYYMRQYRYTPTETVCYAIPKDRMINKL